MRRRICLVTTGQPSTNPRLVKEADALAAAGHRVHVIGARRSAWADDSDKDLLRGRTWSHRLIDHRNANGSRSLTPGLRYRMARLTSHWPLGDRWLGAAVSPVTPDLTSAAQACPADLYIAHNLGALPAAAAAAHKHKARLGFDAEDFHSGQFVEFASTDLRIARKVEKRFLPLCDYVTAASPGVAEEYAPFCKGRPPTVILNVFPMSDRPAEPHPGADGRGTFRLYWFSQTIGRDRGLEDVVEALGELWDIPVELHLRGEWQADYEDRLRGLATKVGLHAEQLVVHPPAAARQMVRLAAPYDIGLALEPGVSENNDLALSNKIFTYLLAGVPVIASATTAQRALADTLGPAAKVFKSGDVSGLNATLRGWLGNPAALAAAREDAWNLGARRFNWDIEQQKFLAIVEGVLGKPTSRLRLAELAS
jgi:glycosyltransferase involved in cell wall biosynthesis